MKRSEFGHAIRAAGSILGTTELIVIGSQAIHATVSNALPEEAQRSIEVDIVAFDDPDGLKADLIDGSNRQKDVEFCRALLTAGIVARSTLRARLEAVPDLDEGRRDVVARRIDRGK